VTKDERLDRHIEACLVVWLERIRRNYYLPHNRRRPNYERVPLSALKPGDWVYSAPGVPLAQIGIDGRTLVMGRAIGKASEQGQFLVKVNYEQAEPCQCEPCTIYRTCFPDKVA
jgi:hypothetical protein